MPLTKNIKRARNLGVYAKKKAKNPPSKPPTPRTQTPPPTSPTASTPVSPVTTPGMGETCLSETSKTTISPSRPPPRELVMQTIPILEERVNPKRSSGVGHRKSNLSLLAWKVISSVLEFFRLYASSELSWTQASVTISHAKGFNNYHARTLRIWGRACLEDPNFTPYVAYGRNHDPLIRHDDFRRQLEDHLREVGKFAGTADVIRFTGESDVQAAWGLTKAVSKTTAKRWMHALNYRWGRAPNGMYIDGHERQDVVEYRQKIYVPTWKEMESRIESFAAFETKPHMDRIIRRLVAWFHDECTFKADDQRTVIWVPQSATPKPTKKSSGPSLMVSHLVSAAHGWLTSPDGQDSACVLFEPGPNREGYFNSSLVCKQMSHVCDILHTPNVVSEHHQHKGCPSILFENGEPQDFYFPKGHPLAGKFKGMAEILKERGDCCLYRILFNQPDFANPTSILERLIRSRGHGFLMLPKFHPELNPIEMCWGKAKRFFRELPEPKTMKQMRKNVEIALASVSNSIDYNSGFVLVP